MADSESDEALMAAYVAGDRRAFEQLFSRLAPKVHGFFLRSFGSVAMADDLLQTTFLKLHRARADYRTGAPLKPWLFTIAARVRLDALRKRYGLREDAGEEQLDAADAAQSIAREREREADDSDRAAQVRDALARLPESQRTVVHLHRYEGMTFAEIAAVLGTTEAAVKLRAFRAYERLRKELAPLAGGVVTCAELRERVAYFAALAPGDPERAEAWRHADECPGCRAELDAAALAMALLDQAAELPAPSPAVLARVQAPILAELDAAAAPRPLIDRVLWALTAVVVMAWGLMLARAKHRWPGTRLWITSGAVAAAAAMIVQLARYRWLAVGIAVTASAAFALAAGAGGSLVPEIGWRCTASELVVASLPIAATIFFTVRGQLRASPSLYAGVAAAGALAGHGELHLSCPVHTFAPHLWVFHVGGVALAAALGAALSQLPTLQRASR